MMPNGNELSERSISQLNGTTVREVLSFELAGVPAVPMPAPEANGDAWRSTAGGALDLTLEIGGNSIGITPAGKDVSEAETSPSSCVPHALSSTGHSS
jgi:hypothetical protein